MLLFLRPFHVGDGIEADGIAGTVRALRLLTTEVVTGEGVYVSVPNGALWIKPIRNLSRLPGRQLAVAVRVPYGADLGEALAVLRGLLDDARVLPAPTPGVAVTALGETAAEVTLGCWPRTRAGRVSPCRGRPRPRRP